MMQDKSCCKNTSRAFIWNRVLNIPFWTLITALPFILYKDLHISKFQLTLVLALKPISALFAPYWSIWADRREDRLLPNIFWANLLRYIPLLFCPWMTSSWQVIAAFFFYMVLSRGQTPAWMEMIKSRLSKNRRERVFQTGNALEYLGTALLPFFMGSFLDNHMLSWQWMFSLSALLALTSTLFIRLIPSTPKSETREKISIQEHMLKPWVRSLEILQTCRPFVKYLIGFMLGGTGLMILYPALAPYFVDQLKLSYTEMLVALGVCKGVGFALASPFWVRLFRRVDIYAFSAFVAALAAIFPCLLYFARFEMAFVYIAFLFYGIMQSGSELSWHMSGPHFAKEAESTSFSAVNVLLVGLRGCFVPFLGGLLLQLFGSLYVMLLGSIFCLMGSFYLYRSRQEFPVVKSV